MKKQFLMLMTILVATVLFVNQSADAQSCHPGKVWVCGCTNSNKMICRCVEEEMVESWKMRHHCQYPQMAEIQDSTSQYVASEASQPLTTNLTQTANFMWLEENDPEGSNKIVRMKEEK